MQEKESPAHHILQIIESVKPKKERHRRSKLSFELHRFLEHYRDEVGSVVLQDEAQLEISFLQLVHLSQEICSPDFEPPFYRGTHFGRKTFATTGLGNRLIKFLIIHFHELKEASTKRRLCPDLQIVFSVFDRALKPGGGMVEGIDTKVPEFPIDPDDLRFMQQENIDDTITAYNKIISICRSALLTDKMREAVKSFKRNATERYKHLMLVAKQAWEQFSDILLIRLDWGFHKEFPIKRMSLMPQVEFEELAKYVNTARQRMLDCLSERFGPDLAFCPWKIEVGEFKGFHIHWLIGVNGSKHQDRINVPRQIAEEWEAALKNERTYVWNVNAQRGMEEAGLRVLNYAEEELWEVVGLFADYLTKTDYRFKPRLPKGMRTFGCTQLKTVTTAKPGPKRRHHIPHFNALDVRGGRNRNGRRSTKSKGN